MSFSIIKLSISIHNFFIQFVSNLISFAANSFQIHFFNWKSTSVFTVTFSTQTHTCVSHTHKKSSPQRIHINVIYLVFFFENSVWLIKFQLINTLTRGKNFKSGAHETNFKSRPSCFSSSLRVARRVVHATSCRTATRSNGYWMPARCLVSRQPTRQTTATTTTRRRRTTHQQWKQQAFVQERLCGPHCGCKSFSACLSRLRFAWVDLRVFGDVLVTP